MRGWKPPDVGHRDHASFINSSRHGRLNIEKHAVCNTGIRTSTHSSRILFMFSGVRPSCQDARVRWQRGRLYIAGFSMGLPSVSQSELLPYAAGNVILFVCATGHGKQRQRGSDRIYPTMSQSGQGHFRLTHGQLESHRCGSGVLVTSTSRGQRVYFDCRTRLSER
jgi:hypothetical protein